jgi:hypothetical protein
LATLDLEAEERGPVGHASGLLHVVRDDHDRVVALELVHQLLDLLRRDRVEGGGGFVEKQHLGLDRNRAGDAESLLLSAREREGVLPEAVLDLVPERRALQRALDALVQVLLEAEHARRPGDVVVDRLRERVRLLEDHSDPPADLDRLDPVAVDVDPVVEDAPAVPEARDRVVHAVETANERALAAARGADYGRDHVLLDLEADALDGHVVAIPGGQVLDVEDGLAGARCRFLALRDVDRPHRRHRNGLVHGLLLAHCPNFFLLRASTARANMLVTSTNSNSTSAVAQARL